MTTTAKQPLSNVEQQRLLVAVAKEPEFAKACWAYFAITNETIVTMLQSMADSIPFEDVYKYVLDEKQKAELDQIFMEFATDEGKKILEATRSNLLLKAKEEWEKRPHYTFDHILQTQILVAMVREKEAWPWAAGAVSPTYFINQWDSLIVKLILDHYAKYKCPPSSEAIKEEFMKAVEASSFMRSLEKDEQLYKENLDGAKAHIEEILNWNGPIDFLYLRDKTDELWKVDNIGNTLKDSQKLFYKGKMEEAVERLKTGVNKVEGASSKLTFITGREAQSKEQEWVWDQRFPKGQLVLLVGNPEEGKSWFINMMASHITTGTPFPTDPGFPVERGQVVILNDEDTIDRQKERFLNEGGDLDLVHFHNYRLSLDVKMNKDTDFVLPDDLPLLFQRIKAINQAKPKIPVRMLSVDPIMEYVTTKTDSKSESAIRPILRALRALAQQEDMLVVSTIHLNKNNTLDSLDRIIGSRAFGGAPRWIRFIGSDRGNPDQRWFMIMKGSHQAPSEKRASQFGFRIEGTPPKIVFNLDQEPPISVNEILSPSVPDDAKGLRAKEAAAKEYLLGLIEKGFLSIPSNQAYQDRPGIGTKTWAKVREELGIVPQQENRIWIWLLPMKE